MTWTEFDTVFYVHLWVGTDTDFFNNVSWSFGENGGK